MTRYILENTKTGAFVVYATEAQAKRAAAHMGWVPCAGRGYRVMLRGVEASRAITHP